MRSGDQMREMIRDHLWHQRPFFRRDLRIPLQELPVLEIREHLPVQVFRVTDGLFALQTFLIKGDTVLRLGSAEGRRGVTSLSMSDLDWDGTADRDEMARVVERRYKTVTGCSGTATNW